MKVGEVNLPPSQHFVLSSKLLRFRELKWHSVLPEIKQKCIKCHSICFRFAPHEASMNVDESSQLCDGARSLLSMQSIKDWNCIGGTESLFLKKGIADRRRKAWERSGCGSRQAVENVRRKRREWWRWERCLSRVALFLFLFSHGKQGKGKCLRNAKPPVRRCEGTSVKWDELNVRKITLMRDYP